MNSEKINEIVKKIIFKYTINKQELNDYTNLVTENILDSITFVKLVSQLEKTFNIEFDIFDLTANKFKNVELISAKVKEKICEKEIAIKEEVDEKSVK